ncbi:MAG TPA: NAD-dependent epimerase/dehydratase family protein [Thermoanaerobaculia bacterium]|jgi:NADH dehydrogenase|nr:NAD-dependent epimerase/dehydratase family protein [Thermoanaerobaculia bacterium]
MKVLVTGGTGVVGTAAVRALLAAGHSVRLFSRHASADAARWQGEVETHEGSISSTAEVSKAAEGCEGVLHIAGIAEENPPELTFERINVDGTRNLLLEAQRAGVRRFVYVSSLGADRGRSAYHASKLKAEDLVRTFPDEWLICRPGNVYGPGDEVISFLLQVVRSSPAAPVIDGGDQPFQPIYAEDLGAALAIAVERRNLNRQVLLLAGPEVTTTHDLLDRLARLTGKDPVRVPVPAALASLGSQVASFLGLRVPIDDNKLDMLLEENVIPPGEVNALTAILGVNATPLDEGLRRLATSQPEQLPQEGVGPLTLRHYIAPLRTVLRQPAELFAEFRRFFFEIVPESTMGPAREPVHVPVLERGATLTLSLPLRGHVQVRVAEITETSLTLVTLAGHPLAGSVTFRFLGTPGVDLRFEVETCERPSSLPDFLAMFPLGTILQSWNWNTVARRAAELVGEPSPEITTDQCQLSEQEEREAVKSLQEKVADLNREAEPGLKEEAKVRLEEAVRGV